MFADGVSFMKGEPGSWRHYLSNRVSTLNWDYFIVCVAISLTIDVWHPLRPMLIKTLKAGR